MSDKYVLANPVEIEKQSREQWDEETFYKVKLPIDGYPDDGIGMYETAVNRLFVPLEDKKQQICDLFREVSSESYFKGVDDEGRIGQISGPFNDGYLNVFVDRVCALVYGEGSQF